MDFFCSQDCLISISLLCLQWEEKVGLAQLFVLDRERKEEVIGSYSHANQPSTFLQNKYSQSLISVAFESGAF